jgi:hypothetical protein
MDSLSSTASFYVDRLCLPSSAWDLAPHYNSSVQPFAFFCVSIMKQLVRRPLLLAFLLSLPLWVVFNNYIVALIVALLVSFLISMSISLYVLNKKKRP